MGREYDAWTREKILEHYWGEHIHLGYYSDEEQKQVSPSVASVYTCGSRLGLSCLTDTHIPYSNHQNTTTGLPEEELHRGQIRLHRPYDGLR